jgi:adenylate cyclase
MTAPDPGGVIEWLAGGARSSSQSQDVLAEMCERLCAGGIPLWRAEVFVRTLHPHVTGRHFEWKTGVGSKVTAMPFESLETAEFRQNLIACVCAKGLVVRQKTGESGGLVSFPVLRKLVDEGVTEFLAVPLVFTNGEIHAAVWTTCQPGGFTSAQSSALEAITHPLARVAEVRALRRTATNLLDTYLGNHTGERILGGQIRRGDVEVIHAAIWLSDLRGFTALADRLPPRKLLELLNGYFDCQVPAIRERGGEVLKFMGDGLLAMFPVSGTGGDAGRVCSMALEAALEARSKVAVGNWAGVDEQIGPVRFGLALHVGEVLYGNIGGGDRLDFTCIGPAINLAARIEKLAAGLGRIILTSEVFARHCPAQLEPIGEFPIRGLGAAQLVFGLADEGEG